ncbi:hypothetical protein M378DRAFT_668601 [Amanita muscaria Koide BX008]|uniref:Uncharacterized protein n=1 Tax=Amanita muscaria (strain Koide BX008) TaxID=946122 RepID=A0A0C2X2K7_AMAMK|nr:hypothetical protein M378DRAFT_668601 [Amanita muscaria Koide BX008]
MSSKAIAIANNLSTSAMFICKATINRTCQALQTLTNVLITASKIFFLTVMFLGLPRYYHHLSSRNVEAIAAVYQQESRSFSCRTYIGSWKAVRNLCVVASG